MDLRAEPMLDLIKPYGCLLYSPVNPALLLVCHHRGLASGSCPSLRLANEVIEIFRVSSDYIPREGIQTWPVSAKCDSQASLQKKNRKPEVCELTALCAWHRGQGSCPAHGGTD